LLAARSLPSPRRCYRKRLRLRRTASGRSLAYNLRFPGQYYQAETGLNQNVQRDFDPLTGKYIESDPMGLKSGLNTYAYSYSRPTQFIDPTGLIACFGGTWNEAKGDPGFSLGFGGYFGKGNVTYTCEKQPYIKCTANYVCIGGGPILGGDLGWSVYGYAVNAPDSQDLAGWSPWTVSGSIGPVGLQAPWGGGISVAPGVGAGAGVAFIKCNVYNLRCTNGNCAVQH
jgi:RHS repeat-associated protein